MKLLNKLKEEINSTNEKEQKGIIKRYSFIASLLISVAVSIIYISILLINNKVIYFHSQDIFIMFIINLVLWYFALMGLIKKILIKDN